MGCSKSSNEEYNTTSPKTCQLLFKNSSSLFDLFFKKVIGVGLSIKNFIHTFQWNNSLNIPLSFSTINYRWKQLLFSNDLFTFDSLSDDSFHNKRAARIHFVTALLYRTYYLFNRSCNSLDSSSNPGLPNKANIFSLYASTPGWSKGFTAFK